jgi:hypothetical protein
MFFAEEIAPRRGVRNSVAIFSEPDPDTGRPLYRHFIGRTWDWKLPRLYVVMCNPSDAGADVEDPTTHRVNHFARSWGYGGWGGVNLADLFSANPKDLDAHPRPVSPENHGYIDYAFHHAKKAGTPVLAAWGNIGARACRDRQFIARAKHEGVQLICLGTTQDGHPKHPLARGEHRIPDDFEPMPYEPPWWGQVAIGHVTVPLHPDGEPVCGRCDGTGASPTVISHRSRGHHDTTDVCGLCGGSGVHPNPFGAAA